LDHLDGVITFDRVDQATRDALEARYSAALA
jgi:peptide deformylase